MVSTRVGGAPVTTVQSARYAASLVSSVIASLIGGVAMALVMVVAYMTFDKTSFLYVLRPIGSIVFGDTMLSAPTATMYLGAAGLHFGIAIVWGIVFAIAATVLRVEQSIAGSLALGLIVGLVSHIIDVRLIAPPLMTRLWGHNLWADTVPPLYSWLGHVAFGSCFALVPLLFRRLWPRWSVGPGPDLVADDPRIR